MFRRIWVAMMIAAIAGVGVLLGMSLPDSAAQEEPSATRSISPATVAPGGEVMVTITVCQLREFWRSGGDAAQRVRPTWRAVSTTRILGLRLAPGL